ncbi:hypothetical protein IAR55_003228 [Kwoniella newhampshirensis]|uniref:Fungal-type protein kinase domain-containing protein n=1 Tax=Kwoniella newhampshirensis TaxID=1651941 RepID=A0AAW0YLX8_9TREE
MSNNKLSDLPPIDLTHHNQDEISTASVNPDKIDSPLAWKAEMTIEELFCGIPKPIVEKALDKPSLSSATRGPSNTTFIVLQALGRNGEISLRTDEDLLGRIMECHRKRIRSEVLVSDRLRLFYQNGSSNVHSVLAPVFSSEQDQQAFVRQFVNRVINHVLQDKYFNDLPEQQSTFGWFPPRQGSSIDQEEGQKLYRMACDRPLISFVDIVSDLQGLARLVEAGIQGEGRNTTLRQHIPPAPRDQWDRVGIPDFIYAVRDYRDTGTRIVVFEQKTQSSLTPEMWKSFFHWVVYSPDIVLGLFLVCSEVWEKGPEGLDVSRVRTVMKVFSSLRDQKWAKILCQVIEQMVLNQCRLGLLSNLVTSLVLEMPRGESVAISHPIHHFDQNRGKRDVSFEELLSGLSLYGLALPPWDGIENICATGATETSEEDLLDPIDWDEMEVFH